MKDSDECLCGHGRDYHTVPDGQPLKCTECGCLGFASSVRADTIPLAMTRRSKCIHVARGELDAFSAFEHATTHGRMDGTYRFVHRYELCAFCAGTVEGILATSLKWDFS